MALGWSNANMRDSDVVVTSPWIMQTNFSAASEKNSVVKSYTVKMIQEESRIKPDFCRISVVQRTGTHYGPLDPP
jgi:hypothetical protein